jgi:GNAT superfamily N-acetyltransferase
MDARLSLGLRSLWRFLRTRGIRHSLDRFVFGYVAGSQRWVLFYNDLDGPSVPAAHGEIMVRPYDPGDAELLAAFEPYIRRSQFLARIEEGCFVHLALHGVRPVGYRIVSTRGPRGPLSRVVRLGPDEVWVVDLYCVPEYRGRGIGIWLGLTMDRHLAATGYRGMYSTNLLNNPAAIRASLKQGDQFRAVVTYRRVLFRKTLIVSTDITEVLAAVRLTAAPPPTFPPSAP